VERLFLTVRANTNGSKVNKLTRKCFIFENEKNLKVNFEYCPPINKADLLYIYKCHVCKNRFRIRTNPAVVGQPCSYAQPYMFIQTASSEYRHMWDISIYLSRL
jgi:hypothetical protein